MFSVYFDDQKVFLHTKSIYHTNYKRHFYFLMLIKIGCLLSLSYLGCKVGAQKIERPELPWIISIWIDRYFALNQSHKHEV